MITYADKVSAAEKTLIDKVASQESWEHADVTRKSDKAYDIQIRGQYRLRTYLVNFTADLKLSTIAAVNWTDRRIWNLSDGYGRRGYVPPQGYDWSGIRDSTDAAIDAMFARALLML